MTSIRTCIVALGCGMVLWGAVSAHAGMPFNGMPFNGMPFNGMPLNGMPMQGLTSTGQPAGEDALVEGPREGLLFTLISQQALGKTHPSCLTRHRVSGVR
jgi:hypothetical protein